MLLASTTNIINAQVINIEFKNTQLNSDKTVFTFDLWAGRGAGYVSNSLGNGDWSFMNIRANVEAPLAVSIVGAAIDLNGAALSDGRAIVDVPSSPPEGQLEYGINLIRTNQPDIPEEGVHLGTVSLTFSGPVLASNKTTIRPFNSNVAGTSFWVNSDNAFPRKSFNGPVNQALPVTIASFEISKESRMARLNWTTTEETNSDLFEVQRSRDGKQWMTIQKVKAQGESRHQKSYEAIDNEPFNGENLYRLHMIDKDGTSAYSSLKSITFRFEPTLLFPNPVSDFIYIKFAFELKNISTIDIVNSDGVEIYRSTTNIQDKIDVRKFKTGTYIVTIKAQNGEESNHKVVVIH
jgi:hypothetical protein